VTEKGAEIGSEIGTDTEWTNIATQAAGAPERRQCVQCGGPFHVRPNRPGRVMRYCSRACQQAAHRERHAPSVEELRREVRQVLWDLHSRTGVAELDAAAEDQLAAVLRHARALLGLLPEAAAVPVSHSAEPAINAQPSGHDQVPTVKEESITPTAVTETLAPVRQLVALAGGVRPTEQQTAIMAAVEAGENLVVEAGAGTGKTKTLCMAAETMPPGRRGIYLGYNKAIVIEAKAKFPAHITCLTGHALAMRALGFAYKQRLDGPRVTSKQAAEIMNITDPLPLLTSGGPRRLDPAVLASIATGTVARYCHTADVEIGPQHVPIPNGIDGPAQDELREHIVPIALRMWAELQGKRGHLKFTHDTYLKMWALTEPRLNTEVIMFDEAQDANPAIASVVQAQQAQLIAVGDSNQAIYEWRGAVNALQLWPADTRLLLTQSWRFGPAVADEANKWLTALKSDLRLTGTPSIRSELAYLPRPDAVLCRTNAEAMAQAMTAMDAGQKVGLVGGGNAIKDMATAALNLKNGRCTDHPELCGFEDWAQVQSYVEQDEGADLAVFVRLVDAHGAQTLINAAKGLVDERIADLVVSTAHKAKGREWHRVRIAEDFRQPKATEDGRPGKLSQSEARLAYVSVTRAQHVLDRGSLAWIDDHLAGVPGPPPRRRFTGAGNDGPAAYGAISDFLE